MALAALYTTAFSPVAPRTAPAFSMALVASTLVHCQQLTIRRQLRQQQLCKLCAHAAALPINDQNSCAPEGAEGENLAIARNISGSRTVLSPTACGRSPLAEGAKG